MTQLTQYTAQDSRNLRIFSSWAIGGALAFAASTILLGKGYVDRGPLGWALAAIATLIAVMMVRSYMVFLRHADELLRKIHLEALALGFGAGAVFMLAWRLFERLGAPKLDIVDGLLPMVIFWTIGQYLGQRRYMAEEEEQ